MNNLAVFIVIAEILLVSLLVYVVFFAKSYVTCTNYKEFKRVGYPIWENQTNVCYKLNMNALNEFYWVFYPQSSEMEV